MKNSFICYFFCFFTFYSARSGAETFIGKIAPPNPNGCEHKMASLMDEGDKFSYEYLVCGNESIVLLQEQYEKKENHIYWKVIDEIKIPKFSNGFEVLSPLCISNSHLGTLIVVGKWGKTKEDGTFSAEKIQSAWTFDVVNKKFKPISTFDIVCEGENVD